MTIQLSLKLLINYYSLLILGDPGAVSQDNTMFQLTVNFHRENCIIATNCPWVSKDAVYYNYHKFKRGKLCISVMHEKLCIIAFALAHVKSNI